MGSLLARIHSKALVLTICGTTALSVAAFGAVKKAPTLQEIEALKKEVSGKNSRLSSLKSEMSKLEKELGERNQKLVNLFDLKRTLEGKISTFGAQLARKKETLDQQKNAVAKVLRSVLVTQMSSHIDPSFLLSQKYLLKGLKAKSKSLEQTADQLEKLTQEQNTLVTRFHEYQKVESGLTDLLRDLEVDKNSKASEYVNLMDEKKEKEGMLSQYRALFLADKKGAEVREKVGMLFKSPLEAYNSISYKEKGVTFMHQTDESVKVKATGNGKVVYSGDLSNYGNVVMIDHGNETRSIILGKFTPRVKKGDDVKTGELIAKTTRQKGNVSGKLYFEVRIKNQIQNTVLLIDELATMQNIASSSK